MVDKLSSLLKTLRLEARELETEKNSVKEVLEKRQSLVREVESEVKLLGDKISAGRENIFRAGVSPGGVSTYLKSLEQESEQLSKKMDQLVKDVERAQLHFEDIEQRFQEQLVEVKRIEQLIEDHNSKEMLKSSIKRIVEDDELATKSKK